MKPVHSGTYQKVNLFRASIGRGLAVALTFGLAFLDAHAADGDADPVEVRIVQIQGSAEIMPSGAATWVITQTNQVLRAGDKLRTGRDSRVALQWSDQSVVPFGALTELEILAPDKSDSLAGLRVFKGILSFFHRDKPGRIRILTRGAAASVEGTEFVMEVEERADGERVTLAVLDGKVELSNAQGALLLTNSQQAVAEPGRPPTRTAGFVANNLLQWCFYYPAVLDLNDLPLGANETSALQASLNSYRAGDLLAALDNYPKSRPPASDAERIYHAALLLSVGQVAETEAELTRLPSTETNNRLADSLRTLIAAVKRSSEPPLRNPQLATELLASSYYAQSRATGDESLSSALEFARRATVVSPDFGFAWERVAELEFSFGRTAAALEALNRSLELAPRNAQAVALKGFLLASNNRTREAADWFDRALALDSALANAWLGRGLCRFYHGEKKRGTEDLMIAAALEPQRAGLRDYLGKAWSVRGEDARAQQEFAIAKQLDPQDPTSWLYSALNNQQANRINDAVRDLEKSQTLNDNRAVYRSRLLLDKDNAVRSASLASIYAADGMQEVSLREAAKSVTYDYANYSAHLFLANSYDTLRDPTRFNLRYETPWYNEVLLANLLAPAGTPTLSPNISQQEYFRMFEQQGLGLTTTTDYRSDGQYREVASQFGSYGPFSYSLDLDWQHNDGVRPNNELNRTEWYSQFKYQLTAQDAVFLLTKYQDYHSGDNFQYYDPTKKSLATNVFTGAITTNTAYRPHFTFDEEQKPIALAAYHREWSPGIHTLALGGRLVNEQHVTDQAVPLLVFTRNPTGALTGVFTSEFDINYHNEFETWIGELSQIFQGNRNTLIVGGRFQAGQFETKDSLSNVTIFKAFFPVTNATVIEDMQRWSVYAYDTFEVLPSQLWLTAGVAYDVLQYPANYRQVPVASGQATEDCLGPKGALVWSPSSIVSVRGAYSRSLGGVSLDESYRLEPPQLAGFNQSFRTIMPESLVGSVSAPTFETAGAALDLKFPTQTYIGLIGEALSSDVDRFLGVYGFPNSAGVGYPSSTPQELRYDEYSAAIYLNQLVSRDWAFGLSYKFIRSELEQTLTQVPTALLADAKTYNSSDLHTVSLYALYSHPSGFFARAEGNWYLQNNLSRTNSAGGNTVDVPLPGDDFYQVNLWLGYHFRRNRGSIAVGVLNVTGTDYKLYPLNPYVELPRERVFAARVAFRF
jgi:Tfp pilus assembly protein PilF